MMYILVPIIPHFRKAFDAFNKHSISVCDKMLMETKNKTSMVEDCAHIFIHSPNSECHFLYVRQYSRDLQSTIQNLVLTSVFFPPTKLLCYHQFIPVKN